MHAGINTSMHECPTGLLSYHGVNDVHHGPQPVMPRHLQRRRLSNLQHITRTAEVRKGTSVMHRLIPGGELAEACDEFSECS